MIFLTTNDFLLKLSEDIRNQITDSNPEILDDAERHATAIIQDAFHDKYDLDFEFAKANENRHKNLLRWMLNLTVYFFYERIPDNQVPERVVKNYDDTITEVKLIEQGKRNTSLTKITRKDNQRAETNFRWGSNTKRTHNPY
ncbi:MAG: DUF1320 family protein [Bacteroidales bacterium]|nr:DUF1320 family protein [Bacteroidales bacterium]